MLYFLLIAGVAPHLSVSEESIHLPNDLRQELAETRTTVDRLDNQMVSLREDVAHLKSDVKTILHLLQALTNTGPIAPNPSQSPLSPGKDKKFAFSPGAYLQSRGHRDSTASAPGLSSGISLVGILKGASEKGPNGTNRVDFNIKPLEPQAQSDSSVWSGSKDDRTSNIFSSPESDCNSAINKDGSRNLTGLHRQLSSDDSSGVDSPNNRRINALSGFDTMLESGMKANTMHLRQMGDSASSRDTQESSVAEYSDSEKPPLLGSPKEPPLGHTTYLSTDL